jgi:MFS transporter, DHA1 family, multidrug resistance protein
MQSLPLVYPIDYGFSSQTTSLIFLTNFPSYTLTLILYCLYLHLFVKTRQARGIIDEPERQLIPGIAASIFVPIRLLIFGTLSSLLSYLFLYPALLT